MTTEQVKQMTPAYELLVNTQALLSTVSDNKVQLHEILSPLMDSIIKASREGREAIKKAYFAGQWDGICIKSELEPLHSDGDDYLLKNYSI